MMNLTAQPKLGNLGLVLVAPLLLGLACLFTAREPFGSLAQGSVQRAVYRHALLVGINKYNLPEPQAQPTGPPSLTGKQRPEGRISPRRFQFADLYGPKYDVDAMAAMLKE